VLKRLNGNIPKNLKFLPFEYEIFDSMLESKLIVSRAGAITLTEIAYLKRPSVLVPFPFAQDNHQYINAKYFEEKGAAILIDNDELKDSFDLIINIFNSPERLNEMKYALNDLFIPEAESRIVKNLC
jgi:UDP-N-acetylglucosamine--N-acetylmuramyl-(pentapeptide) pyrophosphoryl-undecaprenol N-acetylglucosamine transferase